MGRQASLRGLVLGACVLCALRPGRAGAELRLPGILAGNMVLQRDAEVPIWGRAPAGETVTVEFAGQVKTAVAGDDGRWQATLDPMPACAEGRSLVVRGSGPADPGTGAAAVAVTFTNVVVGEVWLCSGQSNMAMALGSAANGAQAAAGAGAFDGIRLFPVAYGTALEPQPELPGGSWQVSLPLPASAFSAVGYFFGLELHRALEVPVGLIQAAQAASGAQAWISREGLRGEFQYLLDAHQEVIDAYQEKGDEYSRILRAYGTAKSEARKQGGPPPPKTPEVTTALFGTPTYFRHPSTLFNGMIAPLIPYAIRGVIWYQGEEDAPRAFRYRTLFPALIRDWRRVWPQSPSPDAAAAEGGFPFYYVQLANWRAPREFTYAELREAQLMALAEPNTGMAVTIDIGDPDNVHFPNKQEVGRRLALIALAGTYGRRIAYSGPIYQSMRRDGDGIRLAFRHVEGGLVARGGPLKGFQLAGEEKVFVEAEARMDGETVVVRSGDVQDPVAVRYGWANAPECNLYNGDGLPASPFRTDAWPGVTEGAR